MNSSNRNSRRANPEAIYKVRLIDGTMAGFPSFARALAVSEAITKKYRDFPHEVGYILMP